MCGATVSVSGEVADPPPAWRRPGPHPSGLPSEARTWALGAHLAAYVGAWIFLAFVGPLVVWLIRREHHPFVDHHATEALNFNLSMLLYLVVGFVLAVPVGLLTIGLGLIPIGVAALALSLAWLILPIVAAVKASDGEGYRYPITIRFIS